VLQELELRTAEMEEGEQRRERERLERQRRWEVAREQAVVKAGEQHRAEVLKSQVDRWHQVQRLDAYLEALAKRVRQSPQSVET
jgi:hypothetical protein